MGGVGGAVETSAGRGSNGKGGVLCGGLVLGVEGKLVLVTLGVGGVAVVRDGNMNGLPSQWMRLPLPVTLGRRAQEGRLGVCPQGPDIGKHSENALNRLMNVACYAA